MIGIEADVLYDLILNYDKYDGLFSLSPFYYIVRFLIELFFHFIGVYLVFAFLIILINKKYWYSLALFLMSLFMFFLPSHHFDNYQIKKSEEQFKKFKIEQKHWLIVQNHQKFHPNFFKKYLHVYDKNKEMFKEIKTLSQFDFINAPVTTENKQNIDLFMTKHNTVIENFAKKREIENEHRVNNILHILSKYGYTNPNNKIKLNSCFDKQKNNLNADLYYNNTGVAFCFNHQIVNIVDDGKN